MAKGRTYTRNLGDPVGVTRVALLALCAQLAGTALAADSLPPESCPNREATLNAVDALLGQSSIRPEDLSAVEVSDLGARFTIAVNGKTRTYTDNSRNCELRARMAAVFVALTLAPPDIAELNEPAGAAESHSTAVEASPAAPASTASTAPTVPSPHRDPPAAPTRSDHGSSASESWTRVELGAKGALSPNRPHAAWGAQARVVRSQAHWGMSLGLDLPARSSFELRQVQLKGSRYTADIALRRTWVLGSSRASIDLGPSLTWLQVGHANLPAADTATRWLPGLRTGVVIVLLNRTISPFLGADVQFLPVRIPIIVQPEGTIGQTSMLWIGATIGIAVTSD